MADVEIDEEKKSAQVVEYLQGPKRKRKNYVLLILNKNFDPDVSAGIQGFLRKNFSSVSIAIPKNTNELLRIFGRQVVLAIFDDNFLPLDELIEQVKLFKEKKKDALPPIIFMTDNPPKLIEAYHHKLKPYQESDSYIDYRSMPLQQIYARIQEALVPKKLRKSTRYDIELPSRFFHLAKNEYLTGIVKEISAHGAILEVSDKVIFRRNDQLKIHLPTKGVLPSSYGEFMKISAKVRRVLMAGNRAAISWEHISHAKFTLLIRFILDYVNNQVLRDRGNKKRPSSSD